jgi:mRNA capping enzyme, beta chain
MQPNGDAPSNGLTALGPPEPPIGILGPWEPSITGVFPHEEITKVICDFLFQQVVIRRDIGAGAAGATATGQGAILEVEAKLGQLVDRDRGGRLHLPVLTECVLSKEDSGIRTSFESSMTLASFSDFLLDFVAVFFPLREKRNGRCPVVCNIVFDLATKYSISSH